MGPDRLAIGVVTSTHGVHGELTVRSYSGVSDHLESLAEAVFRKGGREQRLRITGARPRAGGAFLQVDGYVNPETARALVGSEIWVARAQAAPLARGEYYEADLCRCSLWFRGEEIGPVRSLWDGGPVPLLEVIDKAGKAHLVPFTDHFVGDVDPVAGRIELREDEIVR